MSLLRLVLLCGFVAAALAVPPKWHDEDFEVTHTKSHLGDVGRTVMCVVDGDSFTLKVPGKFTTNDIDVKLCTHIVYYYAKIVNGKIIPLNPDDTGIYTKINNLKHLKPGLKTLLAVGGEDLNIEEWTDVIDTKESRKNFIDNLITFVTEHKFDGIVINLSEIDFVEEEIDENEDEDEDEDTNDHKTKLTLFMKELWNTIKDETKFIVVLTVPGEIEDLKEYFDLHTIWNYVDYLVVMGFDLNDVEEGKTGLHSPLRGTIYGKKDEVNLNQETIVHYMMKVGVPMNKLVLGLGLFGRTFTLEDPTKHGIGAPTTGLGLPGKLTKEEGLLSYYEICEKLNSGWKHTFMPEQSTSYAYHENQWVSFDNVKDITEKVNFVKDEHLAGVMAVTIDMDDFTGKFCNQGKFPLLTKIFKVLIGKTY